jgi:glycosyltransferase involved in cell wall biosynthesis
MTHALEHEGSDGPDLTLLVPMHNEEGNLRSLVAQVQEALVDDVHTYELLLIDDGSTDESVSVARRLAEESSQVRLVILARNFGKEAAILAGYDHARGKAVVVIDADLQHPPELIPGMLAHWKRGYDVVDAVRSNTRDLPFSRRCASAAFYWLHGKLTGLKMAPRAADFRLMDRAVVEVVRRCREHHRFNRSLVSWAGFRHLSIAYVPSRRHSGRSKWSKTGLFLYALDGFFSNSFRPLRWVGLAGGLVSAMSFIYLLILAFTGAFASGGPVGMVGLISLLGGTQMLGFWLLGEYVGRIYEEVKGRPLYIGRETVGQESEGHAMPRMANPDRHLSGVA